MRIFRADTDRASSPRSSRLTRMVPSRSVSGRSQTNSMGTQVCKLRTSLPSSGTYSTQTVIPAETPISFRRHSLPRSTGTPKAPSTRPTSG